MGTHRLPFSYHAKVNISGADRAHNCVLFTIIRRSELP